GVGQAQQRRPDLVGQPVGLGGQRLLPVAQVAALGHPGLGLVGLTLAPQPAHVLRHRLDPAADVVALGRQPALLGVERHHLVDRPGRARAPAVELGLDGLGLPADPADVEHAARLPTPHEPVAAISFRVVLCLTEYLGLGGTEAVDTTQLLKGVLDLAVLAVVADDDAYRYDILRRLREAGPEGVGARPGHRHPRRPFHGGARSPYVVPSDEGPHRKYYAVTPAGHEALGTGAKTWRHFADVLDDLLGTHGKAAA